MSEVILAADELKPIVEQLLKKYPTNLSGVDSDRIIYLRAKGKKKLCTIKAVAAPYGMFLSEKFILTLHSEKWDNSDEAKRAVAVFDALIRIKDFEEGELSGYSVTSNVETVAKFGADWEDAEAGELSDIL